MSEKGTNLELSDEQREEVRQMLAQFGAKKDKQKDIKEQQRADQRVIDPDPLEESPSGSTIEWTELTAKTRRYPIVRETRAIFTPYIMDKIPLSKDELNRNIELIGMDITSQNNTLTVCSVTQADPIRIFQIQTVGDESALIIDTTRYIV
jgi:hypothetical protein